MQISSVAEINKKLLLVGPAGYNMPEDVERDVVKAIHNDENMVRGSVNFERARKGSISAPVPPTRR